MKPKFNFIIVIETANRMQVLYKIYNIDVINIYNLTVYFCLPIITNSLVNNQLKDHVYR
jgi:hypothetical protein